MGCTFSSNSEYGLLRPSGKWKMDFSKYDKQLNENDLDELRLQFWNDRVDNDLEVWAILRKCCDACLKNNYDLANRLICDAEIKVSHHDLSECTDNDGSIYEIDKYCFSTPCNLIIGKIDEEETVAMGSSAHYHFRVQSTVFDVQPEFTIEMKSSTTIAGIMVRIKEKLKEKYNIEEVHSIKLIYRGSVMEEIKTIDNYGVNPEYIILAIVN